MPQDPTWLPECLAHLNEPYLKDADEYVVIGELTSSEVRGYQGIRQLHSALVPLDRVEEVLSTPGGIGWKVDHWGPQPFVEEGQVYKSDFWIQGPNGREDRLEPLVVSWTNHNKTTMMPDNGLLGCYGLSPRTQKNPDRIVWDNLSGPEYEVISVSPLSHYEAPSNHSGCEVRIDRRYLEDYANLKGCAVVMVFYEDRRCKLDDELVEVLNGQEGVTLKYPGREIVVRKMEYHNDAEVFCRIWGCRLALIPSDRPISEEQELVLDWPNYPGAMSSEQVRATPPLSEVYVSDQVLEMFEGRAEFSIHPQTGSVSYGGWWALSYCRRIGRDFIAYEIKKIYEGCPHNIITHVHRYAVQREVAQAQQEDIGDQNIGHRAEALVEAFLSFGEALVALGEQLRFPFQEEDVISMGRATIKYHGWWTMESLKPLGHRAGLTIKKDQFLDRCKTLYKLFEGLKEKPLRMMITQIGLENRQINQFRSMKLLATLLQLCEISIDSGLDITAPGGAVAERWSQDAQIEALRPLFALVDLRNAASHDLGAQEAEKVQAALEVFQIQEEDLAAGWGLAVDRVYDRMVDSLNTMTDLLRTCVSP